MRAWNYTRMCIAAIAIAALVLCMPGCNSPAAGKAHGRRAVTALLDSAESMMNQAPEQAYRLLDSIDSRSLRSRALNARYALLFTEAQYKCYIQAPDDSLIMTAVKYYSVGNHPEQLFRSFYCLGCIYNESGRLVDAAVALEQAEQLADKIDDGYRKGLLYTQLGNVFFYSYDFNRAVNYYRSAFDSYTHESKETHRMHALFDIGECMIQMKNYDTAHLLYNDIQIWAETNKDYHLLANCLLNRLLCSIHLQDKEQAKAEIEKYIDIFGYPAGNSYKQSLFARYYILIGDTEKAFLSVNDGWNYASTKSDSLKLLYSESLLDEKIGKLDTAIVKYKHTIELQNRNIYDLLDQPILGAQKDYYKNLAETESLKASRTLRTITLLSFCFLLMIVSFFQIIRSNRLKFESDKKDLMLTIKELKLKDDLKDKLVNEKNKRINSLFSKQYAELDDIFGIMIELETSMPADNLTDTDFNKQRYYKNTASLYKQIHARLEEFKSPKNQNELKRIINENYNNIMDRLADIRLKLTDNDQLIMLFLLSGFSPKVVAHIVSQPQNYIYQKRNRIISRIEKMSSQLAGEVYNILKVNR